MTGLGWCEGPVKAGAVKAPAHNSTIGAVQQTYRTCAARPLATVWAHSTESRLAAGARRGRRTKNLVV